MPSGMSANLGSLCRRNSLVVTATVVLALLVLGSPPAATTMLSRDRAQGVSETPHTDSFTLRDDATGGDCELIGSWDATARVCTLGQDLLGRIVIDSDGMTLDGGGYAMTGDDKGIGVALFGRQQITIRNLTVSHFQYGIGFRSGASYNTVEDVVTSHNEAGIDGGDQGNHDNTWRRVEAFSNTWGLISYAGSNNLHVVECNLHDNASGFQIGWSSGWLFENSTSHHNTTGIAIDTASGGTIRNCEIYSNLEEGIGFGGWGPTSNTITGNRIHDNGRGFQLACDARWNVFTENEVVDNAVGVRITRNDTCPNYENRFYRNDFLNAVNADVQEDRYTHLWDNGLPDGGNFWSDYSAPSQGCNDSNLDGFCDAPYVLPGGSDNYPRTAPVFVHGLRVAPTSAFSSRGLPGGPFSPGAQAYTLSNFADFAIDFSVSKTQPWVSLDDGGGAVDGLVTGTLAPGATANVTVLIDADANALMPGTYADTVSFANLTDGQGNTTRGVNLRVRDPNVSRIVFASERDGNREIYVMTETGEEQTRLTNDVAFDNSPAWSPDGSKIAFWSDRDGQAEIYVMNEDGSDPHRVTTSGGQWKPDWSPDGTRIVYTTLENQIAIINVDGTGFTQLTNGPGLNYVPAWSPDGSKIAFQSDRDGQLEIYVIAADGSGTTRITNDSGEDGNPAWSPDGSKIAFNSTSPYGTHQIWVMNADGTGRTQLTSSGVSDTQPTWSPDGSRIAFVRGAYTEAAIFVMNADGTDEVEITPGTIWLDHEPDWEPRPPVMLAQPYVGLKSVGDPGGPFSPVSASYTISNHAAYPIDYSVSKTAPWISLDEGSGPGDGPVTGTLAPGATASVTVLIDADANGLTPGTYADTVSFTNLTDGQGNTTRGVNLRVRDPNVRRIAFNSSRDGNWEIYVMTETGEEQTRLTSNSADDFSPAWSADATKIAFWSNRDGQNEIYVMNDDGSDQRRVTTSGGYLPDWSPEGTRIVYTTSANQIAVINLDGTGFTPLTDGPGQNVDPAWSPDGTKIVFWSDRDGGPLEIYVMNADGSGQTRITNNWYTDGGPSWSPDGSKIGFSRDIAGNNMQIFEMNADGTGEVRLTNNSGWDSNPSWSPDGTRITFQRGVYGGDYSIFVMNGDGTGEIEITPSTSGSDAEPDWEPGPPPAIAVCPGASTWECAGDGAATVTLDGTASHDPEGRPLTYRWTSSTCSIADPSAPVAVASCPLGANEVVLVVNNGRVDSRPCRTTVTVVDTTPPVGGITYPANGACLGLGHGPVVVQDDFADACVDDLTRTYVPEGGPTYATHGDWTVAVTATDPPGNTVQDTVSFTIDLIAPDVQITSPVLRRVLIPSEIPLRALFETSDDDGALGDVVKEVMRLDGCVLFDGDTWGDKDGLLSDEVLLLTQDFLCAATARCGVNVLDRPTLRIDAWDCGGNMGFDAHRFRGSTMLRPGVCGPVEVPGPAVEPRSEGRTRSSSLGR